MKKIILLFVFACTIINAYSQDRGPANALKAISIGPELDITQRSRYSIGYGASVNIELPILSNLSIEGTAGYHSYVYRSALIGGTTRPDNDNFAVFKGGAKYYFTPQFYTEGELGTSIGQNNDKAHLFAYVIGTGVIIPLGANNRHQAVDLGIRFEDWSKNRLQQLAIRVAYRLAW